MARPTTPRLSPDRIRDTALEIIDEHGLAALSMRLLADTLSVRPSSLYGHFSTKDDVLDAVANRVISGVDTGGFERGWRTFSSPPVLDSGSLPLASRTTCRSIWTATPTCVKPTASATTPAASTTTVSSLA